MFTLWEIFNNHWQYRIFWSTSPDRENIFKYVWQFCIDQFLNSYKMFLSADIISWCPVWANKNHSSEFDFAWCKNTDAAQQWHTWCNGWSLCLMLCILLCPLFLKILCTFCDNVCLFGVTSSFRWVNCKLRVCCSGTVSEHSTVQPEPVSSAPDTPSVVQALREKRQVIICIITFSSSLW